jgi:hypothetical protein
MTVGFLFLDPKYQPVPAKVRFPARLAIANAAQDDRYRRALAMTLCCKNCFERTMPTTLDQYRAAKADYLKFRNQAKRELIARFNELASEILRIQQELLEDFGEKITIPAKPKKSRTAKSAAKPEPERAPESPKVAAVQKKLAIQRKKLEELRGGGKPTKSVEDRIYELEDELRLAKE